ncbi:ABC transporter substrate-binding protein [Amycolatopsis anabasis]|uniref:ABC transporter substrate-binding protein n=1 Tax=Amycolatopsis anabasis TaxID=1840409 RepID=UPI00131CC1D1|nr:ABC transporter substrate-binding protein [Amycolatopsis anabasis]
MSRLSRRSFLSLAAVAGAAACSAPEPASSGGGGPAPAGFPLTVDNAQRTLTFERPPERVVSLYPSMTELLIALGAGDRIVGQAGTSYSRPLEEYRARFDAIPVLSESEAATEPLLGVRPDLVVSDQEYHFDGKRLPRRDDLAAKRIQVYINQALYEPTKVAATVPDSFADITNLGRIFAAEAKAKELVDGFRARLSEVEGKLAAVAPVRAVLLTSYDKAIYAHAGGLYGDVLRRAGAKNLTEQSEIPPGNYYGQLSTELIARKNPDVVVYVFRDDQNRASTETELRQALGATAAGQANRFVPIAEASFGGGLRSAPAVASLAKALHPGAV